jgi:transposase-like protein
MEGRCGVYPPEVRKRAVRLVVESRGHHDWGWAAMWSVVATFGVGTPETVRQCVSCGEVGTSVGPRGAAGGPLSCGRCVRCLSPCAPGRAELAG